MIEIVIDANQYETHSVLICYRVTLSEEQWEELFAELDPQHNPLQVEATDLRDYLDGKGELALMVELGGEKMKAKIDTLLDILADRAANLNIQRSVVDKTTLDRELDYIGCRQARCVIKANTA